MFNNTIFSDNFGQDSLEYIALVLIVLILAIAAFNPMKQLVQNKKTGIVESYTD